ncbi:glycoside hydrolase family 5 protein [Cylindrobasidium torrendii FP15055 ss-10]|uniref:Glycoside hydrolase family 5 protein n=1 Tax=Cylindrobasidium torrendii FP15055 ss-10 TaxID=1314674 RepID=A0A0D7BT51_9AGAR|nr:glycoside hydrolase family 5 protein [Cylindrobasidium torrendii FP15055 ss-10]
MSVRRAMSAALAGVFLLRSVYAFSPTFDYDNEKVRGVNLGGWLVGEPWITPSLFENTGDDRVIDDYTFGQYVDRDTATSMLKQHWDTWITESDFAEIAAAGLNHVRLPIGYWAFDVREGEPYISGQAPYLEKALGWAQQYGLKVVIDLHGVPGSQNGFDNSGQKTDNPTWPNNSEYVQRSNDIIKTLASWYKDRADVVAAIAPLNEPAGFRGGNFLSVTEQYWKDSYGNIRFPYGSDRQSNNLVLVHDAFQELSYWDNFGRNFDGVAMDTHIYQMFSDAENQRSWDEHISFACGKGSSLENFHLWTIVGEWTPAITDCAKWLNGRFVGARYDGSFPGSTRVGDCGYFTGSGADFADEYKEFLRKYWEAQTITYERGTGWLQWTWKAEYADEWTYQAGLQYGWIPQDPTDRQYADICG